MYAFYIQPSPKQGTILDLIREKGGRGREGGGGGTKRERKYRDRQTDRDRERDRERQRQRSETERVQKLRKLVETPTRPKTKQ